MERKIKINLEEKKVTKQVCNWLQSNHPQIIYRLDIAVFPMSIGARLNVKKMHGEHYNGYPDLFIAKRCGMKLSTGTFGGLYIEIKKDRDSVLTKKGVIRNSAHIKEQLAYLKKLSLQGYCAIFGTGVEDTIDMIQKYFQDDLDGDKVYIHSNYPPLTVFF
jgi:hypothetical protein